MNLSDWLWLGGKLVYALLAIAVFCYFVFLKSFERNEATAKMPENLVALRTQHHDAMAALRTSQDRNRERIIASFAHDPRVTKFMDDKLREDTIYKMTVELDEKLKKERTKLSESQKAEVEKMEKSDQRVSPMWREMLPYAAMSLVWPLAIPVAVANHAGKKVADQAAMSAQDAALFRDWDELKIYRAQKYGWDNYDAALDVDVPALPSKTSLQLEASKPTNDPLVNLGKARKPVVMDGYGTTAH